MTVHLPDTHRVKLNISPKDAAGQPAKVDGAPVWTSSDETVATVSPAADGLSADVISVAPGTTTITVTGDVDLGAGVKNLSETTDVIVEAGEASDLGLTVGVPEPK